MIGQTKAIVLSAIKYGDADLIVTCFTESAGTKSYMLRNILRAKKSGLKASFFQPLTQLEIVANHKNKGTLDFIREARILVPYDTAHTDIVKGSLVMFLAEILKACIREEEPNHPLFTFLSDALVWLDKNEQIANFHISFLLELSAYLGFYPDTDHIDDLYFNLMEGRFQPQEIKPYCINHDTSMNLKYFLSKTIEETQQFRLTKEARALLLETLVSYYQLHIQGFRKPKSMAVFTQLFH